jgi:hypothetical protein
MKKLVIIGLSILVFIACREKKTIDVQEPEIVSVNVDGSSTSSVIKTAGDVISFEVNLSDNSGLNQVQISLHNANDGHSHSGGGHTGDEDRLNSGNWGFSEVVTISGTSAQHTWELQIPDSIGGKWHALFTVLDEVGLVGESYTVLIEVGNGNLPLITATTFPITDETGTIHMSNGNNLNVSGLASDVDGLKKFIVYMQNLNGQTGDTLDIPIIGDGQAMAFGPANFYQSNEGTFRIVIEAKDSLGYVGKWDAKVVVD